MGQFKENPTGFSAECAQQDGQCIVVKENILFLDDGTELDAVDRLQWKCGYVVVIPDLSRKGMAVLYHTSCQRMADVVGQIFQDCLGAPESLPQHGAPEMTLGELHRQQVTVPYEDCRARVEDFDFQDAP